ncbi:PcfB family protein [Christensenellaceae bacterium OttesenSCG-928-K19]|nr:PcfB family protein [Christensenellaceae bacterium OttesenSCG-928-K19]
MESEVMRYVFQGVEITMRMTQEAARNAQQVVAFLAALIRKNYDKAGVKSLKAMLQTGEPMVVGAIPLDRSKEFLALSKNKEAGFPAHDVALPEQNILNVLFKKKDIPKFNRIIEQMGLVKEDVTVSEFQADSVKESVKSKLERCAEKVKDTERVARDRQKEVVRAAKEGKAR